MTFSERLNQYIGELGCSAKELAEASGLPGAVISRYRSGTRVPAAESDSLSRLAKGLAQLSGNEAGADAILTELTKLLETDGYDYDGLADHFNLLIAVTELNISRLARFMNYDASFISRIRTRQRRPADPEAFIDGVCRFVSTTVTDGKPGIAALIGKPEETLEDPDTFYAELRDWLCSGKTENRNGVDRFLSKLDEFDLNDYIRSIRFNDIKVPGAPFQFPNAKSYYGVAEMRTGELDFFRATVLSRSGESVFMCSDMELGDMAEDVDFGKKWMLAIALCLKKGLHLHVIHTIDRPFEEMMYGLESWIPVYMTGQISPYYLKNARSGVYRHLNYVSGAAALTGECIAGHHDKGKYYLTKKPEEIAYYREKSELILKKALPLMEIYRGEHREQYERFLSKDARTMGRRRGILSAPPIYTIPDELLSDILSQSDLTPEESRQVTEYVQRMKSTMESILRRNPVRDEVPCFSPEEFSAHPVGLALEGMFPERELRYSYEAYREHLEATEAFRETHENYSVSFKARHAFRNIQIFVHEGEFAMVSKGNAPVVHFVIRQPQLREAIENMILPVTEEDE